MAEVIERFITNMPITPDLLLIDGGIPQRNATLKVLEKYNISIPCISLAKKKEEIIMIRAV